MEHDYTESMHSDNKGRWQVMHTYAHTTGVLPQNCAATELCIDQVVSCTRQLPKTKKTHKLE